MARGRRVRGIVPRVAWAVTEGRIRDEGAQASIVGGVRVRDDVIAYQERRDSQMRGMVSAWPA
jgi:hypothetical protein